MKNSLAVNEYLRVLNFGLLALVVVQLLYSKNENISPYAGTVIVVEITAIATRTTPDITLRVCTRVVRSRCKKIPEHFKRINYFSNIFRTRSIVFIAVYSA